MLGNSEGVREGYREERRGRGEPTHNQECRDLSNALNMATGLQYTRLSSDLRIEYSEKGALQTYLRKLAARSTPDC